MRNDTAHPALHLPERYLAIVQDILRRYLPQAEVWAYGSRVNGDHYDASDLNLVARQPDDLTRPQPDLDEAASAFSESDLPILVQIVDWARIPEAFHEEIEAGYVVLQPAEGAPAAPTDAHLLAPTLQRGSQKSTTHATFGELIDGGVLDVTDGYRAKNSELGGTGLIFLRAGHVTDTHIDFSGVDRFRDELTPRLIEKLSKAGDVAVTTKENSTGRTAFVAPTMPQFVYSPHLSRWRSLDHEQLEPGFLRYWSRSREFDEQLRGMAASTDMAPYLSLRDQRRLEITLPSVDEQRAIANVLGALDDKIEQNRRTAEALERLARVIFRTWFVDFEPLKAKAAGATSFPPMPQPVFDSLPTRFVEAEIGPVPAGWGVKPIAGIASFLNGLALQKYPPRGDGRDLRVIKIAELRKGSTEGAGWASADVPEKYLIHDGDLLFSWSGTLEAKLWFGGIGALNQHLFKVTSAHYPRWFCLLWLRQHLPWFRAVAASKATTMGHIKRGHLQEALVVVPPPGLLDAADRVIGSLYDLFAEVTIESRELARMRDFLLPRLLSGAVRVAAPGESDAHP